LLFEVFKNNYILEDSAVADENTRFDQIKQWKELKK